VLDNFWFYKETVHSLQFLISEGRLLNALAAWSWKAPISHLIPNLSLRVVSDLRLYVPTTCYLSFTGQSSLYTDLWVNLPIVHSKRKPFEALRVFNCGVPWRHKAALVVYTLCREKRHFFLPLLAEIKYEREIEKQIIKFITKSPLVNKALVRFQRLSFDPTSCKRERNTSLANPPDAVDRMKHC